MKNHDARCDKCRSYRIDSPYATTCHKDPPTFQRNEWGWPVVYGDAWCGKFAPLFAACDMKLKKSAPLKEDKL